MIFITGSESFIGKKLILKLKNKNIQHFGIDIIKKRKKNYACVDIRSNKVEKYIPRNSIIIHLAAISNHKQFEKDKINGMDININGTINLIKIAEKKKCKQFIFSSSEWVYGNKNLKLMREKEKINIDLLTSNYAKSKAIGENFISNSKEIKNKTILRFGIIYSDRIKNGSAVEDLYYQVLKKKSVHINNKESSRRFIHVDDIISGIIKSIGLKGYNVLNLAGKKDISMKDIIITASKILNKKVNIIEKNKQIKNISIRKPDISLAKVKINWKPLIDIKEGLNLIKKQKT